MLALPVEPEVVTVTTAKTVVTREGNPVEMALLVGWVVGMEVAVVDLELEGAAEQGVVAVTVG